MDVLAHFALVLDGRQGLLFDGSGALVPEELNVSFYGARLVVAGAAVTGNGGGKGGHGAQGDGVALGDLAVDTVANLQVVGKGVLLEVAAGAGSFPGSGEAGVVEQYAAEEGLTGVPFFLIDAGGGAAGDAADVLRDPGGAEADSIFNVQFLVEDLHLLGTKAKVSYGAEAFNVEIFDDFGVGETGSKA